MKQDRTNESAWGPSEIKKGDHGVFHLSKMVVYQKYSVKGGIGNNCHD